MWDALTGDVVHTFDHQHIVKSVNFDTSDQYLVTASNERKIRIFDLNQPDAGNLKCLKLLIIYLNGNFIPLLLFLASQVFSGHFGGIKTAMFFRDDKTLISAGEDCTIRVWDRTSGQVSTVFLNNFLLEW